MTHPIPSSMDAAGAECAPSARKAWNAPEITDATISGRTRTGAESANTETSLYVYKVS